MGHRVWHKKKKPSVKRDLCLIRLLWAHCLMIRAARTRKWRQPFHHTMPKKTSIPKDILRNLLSKSYWGRQSRWEGLELKWLLYFVVERKLHLICKFHIPGRNLEQISTWGKCGVDCSCKSRNEITNENDLFFFKKKVIFRSKSF